MTRGLHFPVVADPTDPNVGLAAERVRVAHELHDGVIQTLVAVSLRLSMLRRHPPPPELFAADLAEADALVRRSIGDLRELVLRVRPVLLDAAEFPAVAAESVERFGRDTGIRAVFTCNGTPPRISPEACGQIIRILQEALMNVRRHSGAANVIVSLLCEPTRINLVVDDDGKGFSFEGRWDHQALDTARRGPVVIKERVRLLNGDLTVTSSPGHGARIEINIPCPARN